MHRFVAEDEVFPLSLRGSAIRHRSDPSRPVPSLETSIPASECNSVGVSAELDPLARVFTPKERVEREKECDDDNVSVMFLHWFIDFNHERLQRQQM